MNNNTSTITDISFATTLCCLGYEISFEKVNDSKYLFHFISIENIMELENAYWNNKLTVNPRLYFENLKMIKKMDMVFIIMTQIVNMKVK